MECSEVLDSWWSLLFFEIFIRFYTTFLFTYDFLIIQIFDITEMVWKCSLESSLKKHQNSPRLQQKPNRFADRLVRLLCVLWWGALDRLWLRAAQSVRVCSTTGYITSGLRGPSPQALTLFGGIGFIARRLRRPKKGNADGVRGIFGTACRVGLRPCDRTHLKNGLVPYSYAGGV